MTSITEGAELTGETGKVYLAVGALGQANVWTAVERDDSSNIVVLKAPASEDTGTSWPRFQHEMIMHELFKDCSAIRRQVDRIPPVKNDGSPPILVLEIFETTLWQARSKRPFSKEEVHAVAKSILQGLKEVHDRGLVYVDLKMQNVMLNGFDTSEPGDGTGMVTKLGDLGIVMEPANGKAQPVAYRAPEVFFKGELTEAADIWSFGLIYSHLLEARRRFSNTGLYDDLFVGGGSMVEREQAMRFAIANDYDIRNVDYYKDCALPYRDEGHATGQHWDELRKRGINEEEIGFLQWVLKSDPRERPTARALLKSHWFDNVPNGSNIASGATDGPADLADSHYTNPVAFAEVQYDSTLDKAGNGTSANGTSANGNSADGPPEDGTSENGVSANATSAPMSIALPDTKVSSLQDMQTEDAFTPTGSGAFASMLRKRAASGSPIKDHPLVRSAMSQVEDVGKEDVPGESEFVPNVVSGAEEPTPAATEEQETRTVPMETSPITTTEAAAPERPKYMGRKSSSGGTYLSYQ